MKRSVSPSATLPVLLEQLDTTPEGLSAAEALARLAATGPNAISAHPAGTRLRELARAILSPLALVLLGASVVSAFLHEITDAVIIAAVVLLSAALDLWQSSRSTRAMRELTGMVAPRARVRRDGAWVSVPRSELVLGDVVRLGPGDLVGADARLLESTELHVQQAALTGEPFPVRKRASEAPLAALTPDSEALLFVGTSVVSGSGVAVVFATGGDTMFGDIVARLAARPEENDFERGTRRFGMFILQTVAALVVFIMAVNLALEREAFQSLLFALALAVGLTPEFLPMITSVTLAQGALRMAREKVIVKHLPAIQNLGSVDVVCSDKTGTLTSGVMSLEQALDPRGADSERVLLLAHLNSAFESGIESPLDVAILARAVEGAEGYEKVAEIPFDFERRRLSVVVRRDDRRTLVTKGAPESVLACCEQIEVGGAVRALDEAAREACIERFGALSARGYRVLAVGWREVGADERPGVELEQRLVLAGFVTFADQLLPGVGRAIEGLRGDGVRVKILSGDNELVTRTVCEQVGVDVTRVVTGAELDRLDELALSRVAEEVSVFARLSPAQKHRVVLSLKHHGHVVGFLGDGINDAPSLHGADVGISVAGAVDLAREASDIVLLEKRLEVLHAGIVAGRRSSANVLKYLLMGTSSNFGNMLSMAVAVLFLPFLPMLPTQILVNSFLYDLAQITIPTDRVDPELVRRPQRWDIGLIRKFMLLMGPVSSVFDFATFAVLLLVFRFGESLFQTGWFIESLASQVLVLFVIRTFRRPWRNRPSLPLALTVVAVTAAGVALPYTPLARLLGMTPPPTSFLLFVALVVPAYLLTVELLKGWMLRRILPGAFPVKSLGQGARDASGARHSQAPSVRS